MNQLPGERRNMRNVNGNDSCINIITQAISEMEAEQGKSLSADEINLAELERRTGITRARLRRLKSNNFKPIPHGRTSQHAEINIYCQALAHSSVLP